MAIAAMGECDRLGANQNARARSLITAPLAVAMLAVHLISSTNGVDAASLQRLSGECLDLSYRGVNVFNPGSFFQISSSQPAIITPQSTTVNVAKDFNITYFADYKVVENKKAFGGPLLYVLYQCGMEPPPKESFPNTTLFFSIPLRSTAVEDASGLAFMDLLGLTNRVSYVSQYAVNACYQSIGLYGCKRLTSGDANNYTDVDVSQVDAIFGYQASNITIAVSAAPDPGPLNRAEWIKYVAAFFNMEDKANLVFDQIAQNYNNVVKAVAAVASANVTQRPLLAWIIWQPKSDYDPQQVQISFAAYKDNYTTDAGGRMLDLQRANASALKYGTWGKDVLYQYQSLILRNFSIVTQQLRDILADVDILVEETRFTNPVIRNVDLKLSDVSSLYGFNATDVRNLKFFRNNKVVREDARSNPDGYTDWFEAGLAQPDVVLRELAAIVTPAAVPAANASQRILRVLGTQASTFVQSSQCKLTDCTLASSAICPLVYRACNGTVVTATSAQRCAPSCNAGNSGASSNAASPPPPPPLAADMVSPLPFLSSLLCVALVTFLVVLV